MDRTVFAGAYTAPAGRATGIARFTFCEETGVLRPDGVCEGIDNPSYLTMAGGMLFCVHESADDTAAVGAYVVDAGHGLRALNRQPSLGGAPCHLAVHPGGRFLCVSNYLGGSIAAMGIAPDGTLEAAHAFAHQGSGPDAKRQQGPHVHSACFTADGGYALVADLGTDSIAIYRVLEEAPWLERAGSVTTPPGSGPRHMRLDAARGVLYAVCELSSQILVYALDARGVPCALAQTVSTLPQGFSGESYAAEIALSSDGRFLYASNRGHNSLAVFAREADGCLALRSFAASGGSYPRHFAIAPSGRWLLCANQKSDSIVVFAINQETGGLTEASRAGAFTPVCLHFA